MGQTEDPTEILDTEPGLGDDGDQGARCPAAHTGGLLDRRADDVSYRKRPRCEHIEIPSRLGGVHDSLSP